MRQIKDVVNNVSIDITKEEILKYFSISDVIDIRPLKVLYYFNISGFYIPLKPSSYEKALDTASGWIEFAKGERRIEYHNHDGVKPQIGDIDVSDFHIITDESNSQEFIRVPDYYIYTNIHLNNKNKIKNNHNLTGEDIYMLDDAKSSVEISICDSHEDGA